MDPTIGITSPDTRRVVREALRNGWQWGGVTGGTHARIVWPATGQALTFGMTPSVASWKTLATDIRKTSGVEVWRKGNRKRSHKAFRPSGFDLSRAKREQDVWAVSDGARAVQALRDEHEQACAQLDALVESGKRCDVAAFRELLPKVREIEAALVELYQPVTAYSPGVSRAS